MCIQPKTWYSWYKELSKEIGMKNNRSKTRKVGVAANGRIDYALHENRLCMSLAQYGFYIKTIASKTGLTHGQVAYRLKSQKVYLSAYRNGVTDTAVTIMKKFSVE
jgi:hypothetical protein